MTDNDSTFEGEDDMGAFDTMYIDGVLASALPLLDIVNILVRKRVVTADELLVPFGVKAPVDDDGQPGPVAVTDMVRIKIGDLLEDLKGKGF